MKKVMKILYVHGYNGKPYGNSFNNLKNAFDPDKYEFISLDYDERNPVEAIHKIYDMVEYENVDLVIGASYGGFLTMCCFDIPRIVVNPCAFPSVELLKIGYDGDTQLLKDIEYELILSSNDGKCIGLFADNDELLGKKYVNFFKSIFQNAYHIQGTHHINEICAKEICNFINSEYFNIM